ncbi:MAG TPA: AraC family transcriptional regulator [Bacteroides sp.]|nr:AraC family transcriptional regulator [Bacteroides sp.]
MNEILYVGLSQSFFAGLMIATKKNPTVADRLLAAWLFLIAIEMGFAIINTSIVPLFEYLFIPFTYGPLLYLYTKYQTTERVEFNWRYILHFIPALAFFITAIVFRGKPVMRLDDFWDTDPFLLFRLLYGFSFFVSITTYSIVAFVLINRHQRNIQNLVSYTSGKITLSWLLVISISFYVTYVGVFIFGAYVIFAKDPTYDPKLPSYFGLTFFAFAFSFYGFKQPGIFNEILAPRHPAVDPVTLKKTPLPEVEIEPKYERSGLKEKDAKEYMDQLLKHMQEKKPYLDVDLTINEISSELNIPRHYLTQVINGLMGKNFYTFINEYRIEEVKKLLVDDDFTKYTLTSIAFEAGFNSKSSFNSVFKSSTGMTPTQFKEAYFREQSKNIGSD